ncbi:MAG: iron ABC transporter substrate-binding protein [Chloroflexota bacterium]|nr:iron ABC transporter substrate-binding protein [Chloroflexota bacterium]
MIQRKFRQPISLLYTLVMLITIAGCIAPSADVSNPSTVTADAGSLIVYSGRSETLVGPLIAQFGETTGIEVEVRYGSTAEIAATLLEEGANSPADVFFAQDPGGLGAVANAGLLAPLPAQSVAQVKPQFRSADGSWVGVSGRARVIVYNTETLSEADLPVDMEGFTDAQWAGRIGWAPTNASFQAMVTAMRLSWGEEKTRAWLAGIQANNPVVFEGNAPIVEAVGAGEIEVGFVNHYYLYRFLAEQGDGFKARNYFLPGGGPGSLVMVSGVGRLAAGANEANALRFVDFLVSTEAQQYFTTETNEYPVIDSVAGPAGLTPLEELNTIEIALTDLADLQGTTQLLSEVGVLP